MTEIFLWVLLIGLVGIAVSVYLMDRAYQKAVKAQREYIEFLESELADIRNSSLISLKHIDLYSRKRDTSRRFNA